MAQALSLGSGEHSFGFYFGNLVYNEQSQKVRVTDRSLTREVRYTSLPPEGPITLQGNSGGLCKKQTNKPEQNSLFSVLTGFQRIQTSVVYNRDAL